MTEGNVRSSQGSNHVMNAANEIPHYVWDDKSVAG